MALRRAPSRLPDLWQFPLLVISLGLFGYAAYRFIDPKAAATAADHIELAEVQYKHHLFEAAVETCNKLLSAGKLKTADEARVHLLLAETVEAAQKERRLNLPSNHQRIIAQTELAMKYGLPGTTDSYRRLGESLEALGRGAEALDAYRQAVKLDKTHGLPLQRKVIELELALEDPDHAEASLEQYLKAPNIDKSERAWAMDIQAQVLIKRGRFAEARAVIEKSLLLDPDPAAQGVAHYWLGYCLLKLKNLDEAERVLRLARDQLTVGHALDAEAAYLLGTIRQEKNDPREAIAFYEAVLISHPESRPAPLCKLGRGLCRIQLGLVEAALSDLHDVASEVTSKKTRAAYRTDTVTGLKKASAALAGKQNYQGAIELLEQEQGLVPEPASEFYARLASLYEHRADQLEKSLASIVKAEDKLKIQDAVRKFRTSAGDAYIALSRGLTVEDDRGHGEALSKAIDLFDRAGALPQAIAAMERFIDERPDDGQTPEALLRLGRAYQATGQFDKAIKVLRQDQFRYPQSLAASKSGVPLAQCFIAKGIDSYPNAEKALRAVLDNNLIITPEAAEFRQALFELAQLYYRTGRYEEAIARLEEMTERYPQDPHTAQLLFVMADSYRKSAALLAKTADATTTPPGATPAAVNPDAGPATRASVADGASPAEAATARHDRLASAKGLFDRVIECYHLNPPTRDLDKLYQKLSQFYRADCVYDLGDYEEAIRLYDAAALRYTDDPASVAAYVQIVNAYCALGRKDDARTAAERAKWLLRRMPASAFDDAKNTMPKQYWDDWLRQTNESGIFSTDPRTGPVSDAR